jgi:hypothetical protein
VITSLLREIRIDDEETVRKISFDFTMLLNRFFTYNLSNIEFSTLEKDFFHKLENLINS